MSTSNAEISITQDRVEQESRAAITAAYFGAFIALGLTTGALGPTLPGLAARAHVRLSVVSYLFTVRSLGYVFGSLRGGRLFDRRAGNPVIAVMLIAMAAMLVVVPLTPSFLMLAAVILVLGAAEATLDVGANTLLVWTHGHRVGPVMNVLHSCFGIGAMVAPVIVAVVVSLGRGAVEVYPVLTDAVAACRPSNLAAQSDRSCSGEARTRTREQ